MRLARTIIVTLIALLPAGAAHAQAGADAGSVAGAKPAPIILETLVPRVHYPLADATQKTRIALIRSPSLSPTAGNNGVVLGEAPVTFACVDGQQPVAGDALCRAVKGDYSEIWHVVAPAGSAQANAAGAAGTAAEGRFCIRAELVEGSGQPLELALEIPSCLDSASIQLAVKDAAGKTFLSSAETLRIAKVTRPWIWAMTAGLMSLILSTFLLFTFLHKKRRARINNIPVSTKEAVRMTVKFFVVDPETNSISLSAVQFWLWTIAIVSGYLYLSLSWTFVQGAVALATVPHQMPWLFATSTATIIAATTVSVFRGNSGTNRIGPELVDLWSHGGVIAPEKVQFLVWTVIGVVYWLAITLSYDPATIANVPDVPAELLNLAGISAAAYLGGKFVRRPGPKVTSIKLLDADGREMPAPGRRGTPKFVEVAGERIARNASFYFYKNDVKPPISFWIDGNGTVDGEQAVRPIGRDGQPLMSADVTEATTMRVRLEDAQNRLQAPFTLIVVNPDMQRAEYATT